MIDVNVTLVGDTVVLKTDADITEARNALAAAHSRDGRYVWVVNQVSTEVLFGAELKAEDVEKLAGADATEDDLKGVYAADYVRYNDTILPLNDFSTTWGLSRESGLPTWMEGWHSYVSDSFYSGLVLRYNKADDWDDEADFTGESGVTIATFITG